MDEVEFYCTHMWGMFRMEETPSDHKPSYIGDLARARFEAIAFPICHQIVDVRV